MRAYAASLLELPLVRPACVAGEVPRPIYALPGCTSARGWAWPSRVEGKNNCGSLLLRCEPTQLLCSSSRPLVRPASRVWRL